MDNEIDRTLKASRRLAKAKRLKMPRGSALPIYLVRKASGSRAGRPAMGIRID
jgi:hypothetical protein